MSDCEQFAQIAQDKWATVSESLRSLRGNEQLWAIRSGCSEEMSDLLKKILLKKSKILFYYVLFKDKKKNLSNHERFAQVAQRKWVIVSQSLRSLTTNERMSELLIF